MGASRRAGLGRGVGTIALPGHVRTGPRPRRVRRPVAAESSTARQPRATSETCPPVRGPAGSEIIAVLWAGNGHWRASPHLPRQKVMRSGLWPPSTGGKQESAGRLAVQRADPTGCVKLPHNPQQVHCLGVQTLPTQRVRF